MRIGIVLVLFAAGAFLLCDSCSTYAHQEQKDIDAVAAAFRKGDTAQAQKLAASVAKDIKDMGEFMEFMRPHSKGLMRDGNVIAALAAITANKAPAGNKGLKNQKAWINYADSLRDAGLDFAKAKGAAQLNAAAKKVDAACTRCHLIFKPE